ncbi:lysozyme [Yoonia sp. R2331]|uniref:lysozyme n=1 Tax=Yoonia sp. R2331 TaxID=3237238 RepID=UPI0034E50550
MQISDKGVAFLAAHEGIVPGPYFDSVGVMTYGIGHTAAAGSPFPASMKRGMPTDLDAELRKVFDLFAADLEKYAADVRRAIKVPLAQHEFDAAVSFHFNTGAISKATWVKKLNKGDKAGAIRDIMNWRKPKEIIPRRTAERDLFAKGTYGKTSATVWNVTEAAKVVWKAKRTLSMGDMLDLMDRKPTPAPVLDIDTPKAPQGGFAWLTALLAELFRR